MSDRLEIMKMKLSNRISDPDRTVLYLANKLDAMVLSSDKRVREVAKNKEIEYHGMLWIFDQLVSGEKLSPGDAKLKLGRLCEINLTFQNNEELDREVKARLKRWSSFD